MKEVHIVRKERYNHHNEKINWDEATQSHTGYDKEFK